VDEKQRYAGLLERKTQLSGRMQAICSAQEALSERDRLNVVPQKPAGSGISGGAGRKSRDTADYAVRKRYREALEAYLAENSAVLAERLRLMGEFLAVKAEFDGVEETEKWLLLSMALGNQSSLLGFMQGDAVGEKSE
jgi:hypothetical protein